MNPHKQTNNTPESRPKKTQKMTIINGKMAELYIPRKNKKSQIETEEKHENQQNKNKNPLNLHISRPLNLLSCREKGILLP